MDSFRRNRTAETSLGSTSRFRVLPPLACGRKRGNRPVRYDCCSRESKKLCHPSLAPGLSRHSLTEIEGSKYCTGNRIVSQIVQCRVFRCRDVVRLRASKE